MKAVSKRTRSSGDHISARKSSSGHEKSDIGQTVGDFFAPRCRSRSKQLTEDESTSKEEKNVDDKPQDTVHDVDIVKVENVRRSSRLSAQAAASAIARALQVTVKFYFKMLCHC